MDRGSQLGVLIGVVPGPRTSRSGSMAENQLVNRLRRPGQSQLEKNLIIANKRKERLLKQRTDENDPDYNSDEVILMCYMLCNGTSCLRVMNARAVRSLML